MEGKVQTALLAKMYFESGSSYVMLKLFRESYGEVSALIESTLGHGGNIYSDDSTHFACTEWKTFSDERKEEIGVRIFNDWQLRQYDSLEMLSIVIHDMNVKGDKATFDFQDICMHD